MFVSLASAIDAFDVLTDLYVYASIAYILILLVKQLILSFLAIIDEYQADKSDFYQQVKNLLNPSTELILDPFIDIPACSLSLS